MIIMGNRVTIQISASNIENAIYFLTRDRKSRGSIIKQGLNTLVISAEQEELLKQIGVEYKVLGRSS